jgi:hypothetical protein
MVEISAVARTTLHTPGAGALGALHPLVSALAQSCEEFWSKDMCPSSNYRYKRARFLVAIVSGSMAASLSGCGTISQFTNPAISSDHLDESPPELNKLKLVSGDRRLMRVVAESKSDLQPQIKDRLGRPIIIYKYAVCAETQADAISARSAKGTLTLEASKSLADENLEQLTVTNTRTEISDVVRQLGWQLCNARLNGDMEPSEYSAALLDLQARAFGAINAKLDAAKSAEAAAASAKTAAEAAAKAEASAKVAAAGKTK